MDKILEALKNVVANNSGHTFGDLPGRYIVSLPGETVIKDMGPDKVTEAAVAVIAHSSEDTNKAAGVWMHDGDLYVDTSESFDSLDEAVKAGKERKQLAIFDQVEDKVIEL